MQHIIVLVIVAENIVVLFSYKRYKHNSYIICGQLYIPVLDVHAAWYLRVIIAFLHTSTLQSILSTYIAFCFVLSDKIDRLLKACSCMLTTKEISRNFITSGANSPELCARSCKSNYKIGLLNVQGHEC